MANNIAACMQHFNDAGMDSSGIYATDLAKFWRGPEDDTKLQGAIVGLSEKSLSQNLRQTMSKAHLQRILSSSDKFAGSWLTTIPVIHDLVLSDKQMSLAARIRLGLPVDDFLPKKCSCGRNIEKDVSHFLCCGQSGPHSATIKRHDKVVQLLAGYFRKAGAVARVEQRSFDVERSRPDLEII